MLVERYPEYPKRAEEIRDSKKNKKRKQLLIKDTSGKRAKSESSEPLGVRMTVSGEDEGDEDLHIPRDDAEDDFIKF